MPWRFDTKYDGVESQSNSRLRWTNAHMVKRDLSWQASITHSERQKWDQNVDHSVQQRGRKV